MLEISRIETEVRRQLADCEGLVGVLLLGSISAGMQDETSDYDIQLVFTDEALLSHPEYRDLQIRLDAKCDCWTASLGELERTDRHGYDIREYLHACFLIDDNGTLRSVIGKLIRYPSEEQPAVIRAALDGYYDGVFRSLKCFRHGFTFGAYQMAARSMEFFVETLWAFNDQVCPFLNRAPYLLDRLERLPCSAAETRSLMESIARDAGIPDQIRLLDRMIGFARDEGYDSVRADWEGVLEEEVLRFR